MRSAIPYSVRHYLTSNNKEVPRIRVHKKGLSPKCVWVWVPEQRQPSWYPRMSIWLVCSFILMGCFWFPSSSLPFSSCCRCFFVLTPFCCCCYFWLCLCAHTLAHRATITITTSLWRRQRSRRHHRQRNNCVSTLAHLTMPYIYVYSRGQQDNASRVVVIYMRLSKNALHFLVWTLLFVRIFIRIDLHIEVKIHNNFRVRY